jgi:tetratricopeptide (TPR) repeat protein
MNRLFILFIACAALLSVRAQGPDEQYVRIYQSIQEADRLGETGQSRAAAAKYIEAQEALTRFRGIYPGWNDRLINYRLTYIATKLAPLSALLASSPPTGVPNTNVPSIQVTNIASAPVPAISTLPMSGDLENQLKALQAEVERVQADNRLLSAKLKEALSVQPAASDPRELAKAEERIRALQKENELFKVQLAQRTSAPASVATPDLSAKLAEQNEIITTLRTENDILKKQTAELRQKNDALVSVVNTAGTPSAAQPKIQSADLEPAVRNLKAENLALQKQVELWKQVSQSGQRQPQPPANTSATLPLDSERELLAGLRARLDVLEAKPVPYTAEELALFDKGSPALAANIATAPASSQAGNVLPAEGPLRKVARGIPAGAGVLMRAAQREFAAGRYAEAEQKYFELLRQDQDNVTVLADLASAQVELGQVADAEKDVPRALGHFANAEKNVQRVLQLAPDDEFALYLLGRIRFRQDKLDEALDALSRSAKANPNYAEAQSFLGIVLNEKGLRGAAEVALRKAIQLQPDHMHAHYNLAVVYATQKPPALALARWHYKKARNAGHPGNPEVEKLMQ